jgi:hypothetical protein
LEDNATSKIDISQTKTWLPDDIKWVGQPGFPDRSLENAALAGDLNGKGIYYTLLRWYPGYMSAPHYYPTDRLCVVVSGTWWVNSGADFDPDNCVPTPPEVSFSGWPVRHITTVLSPPARNPW